MWEQLTASTAFLWLIVVIVAAVIEGLTVQLVSIWFALGGIAAVVAAALGASVTVQVVAFVAVSVLALILTRPLVKRMTRFQKVETNADRYLGKTAVVTEEIDNTAGHGLVKVQGSVWTARAADDTVIPAGVDVTVDRIEGVKMIVHRA